MSRTWCAGLCLLLALVAVPAVSRAQTSEIGFDKGEWTLTLSGVGGSDNDFDANTFNLAGTLGYLIADNLSLELSQSAGFLDTEANGSWQGSTRVGAAYYFDLENWQPYVGANIGYVYGDEIDEQLVAALKGGVAYFVNSTTYIFGEVAYNWYTEDSFTDEGTFAYAVGIGFTF